MRSLLLPVLLVWAASRLVSLTAVAVALAARPDVEPSGWVLRMWDGVHYLAIAQDGYPLSRTEPQPAGFPLAAFFPAFPLLVRAADAVLPQGVLVAGLAVSGLSGAVAALLVALLAAALVRRRGGPNPVAERDAGVRAAALLCFAPGAFVLSLPYSEGLLLAGAAGCLLLLGRRQWLAAGLVAALTTATRPNALALVAACGLAALVAVGLRREWRALLAPALAPLGVAAYFGWLGLRTGDPLFWSRVQREVWHERVDLGASEWDWVQRFLAAPFADTDALVAVAGLLAALAVVAVLLWARAPVEQLGYAVVVVALPLVSATLVVNPRFLLAAVPVAAALGARVRGAPFLALLGASAALMPLLLVHYAVAYADVAGRLPL